MPRQLSDSTVRAGVAAPRSRSPAGVSAAPADVEEQHALLLVVLRPEDARKPEGRAGVDVAQRTYANADRGGHVVAIGPDREIAVPSGVELDRDARHRLDCEHDREPELGAVAGSAVREPELQERIAGDRPA